MYAKAPAMNEIWHGRGWADPSKVTALEGENGQWFDRDPYLEANVLEFEEELANMTKRTMLKRGIHVRRPAIPKMQEIQKKIDFSLTIIVLDKHSSDGLSGEGDEKGFLVTLYFTPKNEQKLLRAMKTQGIDVTKSINDGPAETKPVDPDSPWDWEQTIMAVENPLCYFDIFEQELFRKDAVTKTYWEKEAEKVEKMEEEKLPTVPVALLFPGQGSQAVGMLKEAKDNPDVKQMLIEAKGILGYDLLELCLKGPEEKLGETQYCHPAMFVGGLAAMAKLKETAPQKVAQCQVVAGLSVGEFTALTAAGVFSFADGLKIVKLRAEAMQEAAKMGDQGMLSVAGVELQVLNKLCQKVCQEGETCSVANYLFPKGFAVAGTVSALERLEPEVKKAGAIQAKLIKNQGGDGGAFHTKLMQPAQEKLIKMLDEILPSMKPPRCTVYMNVTGKAIPAGTAPQDIVKMLAGQLTNCVLWEPIMQGLLQEGLKEFYELGPNKQLKAMMRRVDNDAWQATSNVQV